MSSLAVPQAAHSTTGTMSPPKTQDPGSPRFGQFHRTSVFEQLSSVVTSPLSITKWMGETLLKLRHKNQLPDPEDYNKYFEQLMTSIDKPLSRFSDEVPHRFDSEKFARGRAFAMKHIMGLLYAEELSVVLLMSLPMLRDPLIFSGQSDTTDTAFLRYLSTVERVMSWYAQDIWDKDSTAYHNLMVVRGMHSRVDHDMKSCTAAERAKRICRHDTTTTPFLERLWDDLKPHLPDAQHQNWLDRFQPNTGPFINQLGMTFTQMGFVALLILEPQKFGAFRATQADLDDFVYVWYVLGRQLGIEDRYNLCTGGLEETRQRCKLIIRHLVLPSLATAGPDWEHMSRCVVAGVHRMIRQTSFEAAFAYTLWVLNVPSPRINALIKWTELPRVWLFKWVLCVVLNIPGFGDIFGVLLQIRLGRLRKKLDAKINIS